MDGFVTNIQKYSIHDGGGIRTVVFLQGCPLNCRWCSNPETKSYTSGLIFWRNKCIGCQKCKEVCHTGLGYDHINSPECKKCRKCVDVCIPGALQTTSKKYTIQQVVDIVKRDRMFYRQSGGGVTLSGGEPLVQWEFAAELLAELREMYIDTAIETTGHAEYEQLYSVAKHCNRILYDVKHMDCLRHKHYTGVGNERILENLSKLAKEKIPIIIRVPLMRGINDDEENIVRICNLAHENEISEIHILPFHRLGEPKYIAIGSSSEMEDATVPQERIDGIVDSIEKKGFTVVVGG